MFKDFLIRKMVKSQLKGVPEAEQERILKVVQENPELFQKVALEIQAKVKSGMDQQKAAMEVMTAHRDELQKVLS